MLKKKVWGWFEAKVPRGMQTPRALSLESQIRQLSGPGFALLKPRRVVDLSPPTLRMRNWSMKLCRRITAGQGAGGHSQTTQRWHRAAVPWEGNT